jgi:hypothetical protein
MRFLHREPVDVGGAPFEVKVAGVVADTDFKKTSNASDFADALSAQLTNMATRISNLHNYF